LWNIPIEGDDPFERDLLPGQGSLQTFGKSFLKNRITLRCPLHSISTLSPSLCGLSTTRQPSNFSHGNSEAPAKGTQPNTTETNILCNVIPDRLQQVIPE